MKEWQVNDKLETMFKKRSWPNLRYYPGIYLEELRKTTKACQNGRSPRRDFYLGPPEYEAGVITNRPRRSVSVYRHTKLQVPAMNGAILVVCVGINGKKTLRGVLLNATLLQPIWRTSTVTTVYSNGFYAVLRLGRSLLCACKWTWPYTADTNVVLGS
jgi:hypothetical protein